MPQNTLFQKSGDHGHESVNGKWARPRLGSLAYLTDIVHGVQKVLCSEGSMFRKYLFKRFYVQKVLYSEGPMFRRFYVQKVLSLEGPMFRRSYVQKKIVQKVLYSEGYMFRRY